MGIDSQSNIMFPCETISVTNKSFKNFPKDTQPHRVLHNSQKGDWTWTLSLFLEQKPLMVRLLYLHRVGMFK